MRRSQRRVESMRSVFFIANAELEKSSEALAQASNQLQAEQAKLDQLVNYREEYQQNMREQGAVKGWQLRQMAGATAFLSRLTCLVDEQAGLVKAYEQGIEQIRSQWLGFKQRADSIDTLLQQALTDVRSIMDRREEAEAEEAALQRFVANRAQS